MVIIDASALATDFSIFDPLDSLALASFSSSNATNFTYISDGGHVITLNGIGFSTGTTNNLISGVVTAISIDLDNDGTTDISISALNLDGANLYAAANFNSDVFWEAILDGPTQVLQGDFEFDFTGDFIGEALGTVVGSDDIFTNGSDVEGTLITGDSVVLVLTAALEGGDDSLDTADAVVGDVFQLVDSSSLVGGDDSIVFTIDYTVDENGTSGAVDVLGDAGLVEDFSSVVGGDDLIDLRILSEGSAFADGDAAVISDFGSVTGGDDTIYGGANDDFLFGDARLIENQATLTGGDDILFGGDGNDNIFGDYQANTSIRQAAGGDDQLFGESGDDNLFGNEGNDFLEGGSGADGLDGGAGIDTASYANSASAVVIDLAAGTASGGDAVGDTFNSIENLSGSDFDESLTGDGSDNVLTGLDGADELDGGDGIDTASYASSDAAVTIDLAAGTASGGDADGDTLISIENLSGSNFDDDLTGDSGDNVLIGLDGDDTFNGGAGADMFDGGEGSDTVVYCLLYTSPSPRDQRGSRMPSSA